MASNAACAEVMRARRPRSQVAIVAVDGPSIADRLTNRVYNIPVRLVPEYSGHQVIVRSESTAELINALPNDGPGSVVGVQLLSLNADVDALANWGYAVPVELVMSDPANEFPLLYRNAKLLDKHPMRVLIPARAGFSKAVKLAASLQFNIRIELGQPSAEVIDELKQVRDYYLHQSLVSQPIEPFHGMLMSLYHNSPSTLWDLEEKNPSIVAYIDDLGRETEVPAPEKFGPELLAAHAECEGCELFGHCSGYFKWPERGYSCAGMRNLFATISEAAGELQRDLKSLETEVVQ